MPYNNVKQYPYGSKLKHTLRVEVVDDPADPTVIAVYFVDPSGNQTGPFTPTRASQGMYFINRTYTSTSPTAVQGLWTTFWRGTGAAEGAQTRQFQIATLNIASSI